DMLRQIDRAEASLKDLGFTQVRVRHHGEVARIEVDQADLGRLLERRAAVLEGVRHAGYTFVALDLEGYRTGNLNRTWKPTKEPRFTD
ncbi:MAG: TIGR00268 family protein, partial [Candidatus Dormibacteraeota bacterium]|nr:TIGR00268 family protein [Candidatus Dormibacteraeota bacterium]MBO0761805.1 TIGR00268 family protein [Candidatus Dormibacteraeota bacterium]